MLQDKYSNDVAVLLLLHTCYFAPLLVPTPLSALRSFCVFRRFLVASKRTRRKKAAAGGLARRRASPRDGQGVQRTRRRYC